jgi:hypothetical protein
MDAPSVPAEELTSAGYGQSEDREETLADLPGARAVGRTLVYEREGAFFFATRVGFEPGLPPGGAPLLAPTVFSAADRRFRETLRERGAGDIEARGRERCRVRTGERARMRRYAADIDGERAAATLCCWPRENGFRLAGGGAPPDESDSIVAFARSVE